MALSQAQKDQLIRDGGLDPSQYTIEDGTYEVIPRSAPVSAPSSPEAVRTRTPITPTADQPSKMGSFLRQAAASVIPSGAGIGVAAATSPFITPVGGILAGMGTSLLSSYLQNKALGAIAPSAQSALQRDVEVNPGSSLVGSIAGQGPFIRPGRLALKEAGRAVMDLKKGIKPRGLGSLANVGLGAGLGGVSSIADDITSDRDVSLGRALLGAAGGAVFNEPTRLGRKFGLTPTADTSRGYVVDPIKEEVPLTSRSEVTKEMAELDAASEALSTPEFDYKGKLKRPALISEDDARIRDADDLEAQYKKRLEAETKARKQEEARESRVAAIEETEIKTAEEIAKRAKLEADARLELEKQETARVESALEEMKKVPEPKPLKTVKEPIQSAEQQYKSVTPEQIASVPVIKPLVPPTDLSPTERSLMPIPPERQVGMGPVARVPTSTMEPKEIIKLQPEAQVASPKQSPSKSWLDFFKRIGEDQGIQLKESNGLLIDPKSGKEVAGMAFLRQGVQRALAKINPRKAGFDTPGHELFHIFVDDMLQGPSATRKNLANRAIQEFARAENLDVKVAEEALTNAVGSESVRRALGQDRNFSSAMQDIWSNVKARFGPAGSATKDDWARLMSNKLIHDAPSSPVDLSVAATKIKEPDLQQKSADELRVQDIPQVKAPVTEMPTVKLSTETKELPHAPKEGGYPVIKEPAKVEVKPPMQEPLPKLEAKSDAEILAKHMKVLEGTPTVTNAKGEPVELRLKAQEEAQVTHVVVPERKPVAKQPPTNVKESALKQAEFTPGFRLLEPVNRKILHHKTEGKSKEAQVAVQALQMNTARKQFNEGLYAQKPLYKVGEFSQKIQESVHKKLLQADITGKAPTFTAQEKPLADYLRNDYLVPIHTDQRAMGLKIHGRDAVDNPTYFPSIMASEVQEALTQDRHGKGAQYTKDIIKHWTDNGVENAAQKLDDYIRALSGSVKSGIGKIEFNALRKAEGAGLPESVREKDLQVAIDRYGKRVARDFAFFESIESNPIARAVLDIQDQTGKYTPAKFEDGSDVRSLGATEEVQTALRHAYGLNQVSKGQLAVNRTVSNLLMGVGTGLRDLVNLPVNVLPFIKPTQVGVFFKGLAKAREVHKRAYESGAIRKHMQEMFFSEGVDKWTDKFNALSNLAYDVQRGHLEKFSRLWSFGMGDVLVRENLAKARAGDLRAVKELKNLNQAMKPERFQEIVKGSKATEQEVDMLVKGFVDKVQQTYNANDLPAWAIEGAAAPYFALARWSIGKSNTIIEHVVKPMKEGNFMPFLTYTLGALANGVVIQKLNEVMNNKKDWNPTVEETMYSEAELKKKAAGVMGLMQLGSYAGFIGDVMKMGADISKGDMPRGFGIPLANLASSFTEDLGNLQRAVNSGEDPYDAMFAFSQKLLVDHVQTARIIVNHASSERGEDIQRSEKFRDRRVYESLTGTQDTDSAVGIQQFSNPFAGKDKKRFKRESDPGEAAELLPKLIEDAIRKSQGDPDRLKAELRGLKANNYQTMPNPDTMPREFMRFIEFLKETQGEQAASDRLVDYIQQNEVNKMKSEMVPSL